MDFSNVRVCVICRDPDTTELEKGYSARQITVRDILEKKTDWSSSQWYNHVKNHLKPEVITALATTAEVLSTQIIDKGHDTIAQLDRLNKVVVKAQNMLGGAPDPGALKAYATIESEIRKSIELLGKIQGDFKEAAIVKAKNVTIEYNNVIGTVIQEACPACKIKFAEKLPKILKVVKDEEPPGSVLQS